MGGPVVVGIMCAVALGVSAGAAHAAPPPPAPPCAFTLSGPVAGADGVAATVQSTGCAPFAVPYSSVVCLHSGNGSPADCAQARGADPARVSVPYQPGVVYTATGRGCAGWVGLPPATDCQPLGPNTGPG
jgi:hypothetical protein